jgi:poly-gamma-glutamate capsule biosynthesis protein CapA/YwtB (metallophosphatase superfamily)
MITKTSKIIRYAMITIVLGFFAFFLVSCGKKETITYKDLETEIQNAQLEKTRNALRTYLLPEENADAQTSVYAKITSILTNEAITNTDEFLDNALNQLEALAQ